MHCIAIPERSYQAGRTLVEISNVCRTPMSAHADQIVESCMESMGRVDSKLRTMIIQSMCMVIQALPVDSALPRLEYILLGILRQLSSDIATARNNTMASRESIYDSLGYLISSCKSNDAIMINPENPYPDTHGIGSTFVTALQATTEIYFQDEEMCERVSSLISTTMMSQISFFIDQKGQIAALVSNNYRSFPRACWLTSGMSIISKPVQPYVSEFVCGIISCTLFSFTMAGWAAANPDILFYFFDFLRHVISI